MATLVDSGNINNTVLRILEKKGFQIWNDRPNSYWAEKNGWDFNAKSLPELLGLIDIYEFINPKIYKEYWWKLDETITLENLPKKENSYTPIYKKRK